MQYVGGKQKSGGHHIARVITDVARRLGTSEIGDRFCGGLSVAYRLDALDRQLRDACVPLITLYKAMQDGWDPPAVVERGTWLRYRDAPDPDDPMTAFVGFGCSRSGAWFSSFVADYKYTNRRVPAATAARDSLRKKLDRCHDATFTAGDYRDAPIRGVIYCDIPYAGTLGYPAVGPFDHLAFWDWARETSRSTPVLVSERVAPDDFTCIEEWSVQRRLSTPTETRRVERIFIDPRWMP